MGASSAERFKEARSGTSRGGERIVCDMWCCCSFLSKPGEALGQLVAEGGLGSGEALGWGGEMLLWVVGGYRF